MAAPIVIRRRKRGGSAQWGDAEDVRPDVTIAGQDRARPEEHDRFVAIEASLGALAERNDRLLSQNESLQEQVADMREQLASRRAEESGSVITKVLPVSALVPQKAIEKIRENKYVDFRELLQKKDAEESLQPLSKDAEGNEILIRRKAAKPPSRLISWSDWGVAFSRFGAILAEWRGDSSLPAKLGRHYETVYGLMKSGGKWRDYDERFRRLMETDIEVQFGSLHFDLYQDARTPVNPSPARSATKICLQFNSVRGCHWSPCKFVHICTLCSKPHPAFQCYSRQHQQSSGQYQFPGPRQSGRGSGVLTQAGFSGPRAELSSSAGRGQSGQPFREQQPLQPGAGRGSFPRPRFQGPRV